jgi:hypothetical protein
MEERMTLSPRRDFFAKLGPLGGFAAFGASTSAKAQAPLTTNGIIRATAGSLAL